MIKINKTSDIYDAIEDSMYKIFNCEILLEDPTLATELFVKNMNDYFEAENDLFEEDRYIDEE